MAHLRIVNWICFAGKSIKATVSNYDQAYQDFINVVSVFSAQQGVPIALQQFHNKQGSEIAVVQNLLANLALEGVVFNLDSLHCQKKLYS
jgi:hypothetical protein